MSQKQAPAPLLGLCASIPRTNSEMAIGAAASEWMCNPPVIQAHNKYHLKRL